MINESSIRGFQACSGVAIGVLVAIFVTAPAAAEAPSDILRGKDTIEDLELTGDFLFELDGADLTDAEIYVSQRHVAYLVVTPNLPAPLLISPRGNSVQRVQQEKLTRTDGGATLAAGFRLEVLGEYDLPRPIIDDPHAVEMGIVGVPTAVVFVDEEEVGRLAGRALDTPEESLYRLLAGERR